MEPDALVQTLLQERLRITAAAVVVVRDTHAADDVFQQVVLAALEGRGQFRDADHLLNWAVLSARHRAVDVARRRRLQILSGEVLDLLQGDEPDPAGHAPSDRSEALGDCLGQLPTHARELLKMRYDDGLAADAIARRLNRSADAVYQALSRLHRSLRNCVEHRLANQPYVALEVRP